MSFGVILMSLMFFLGLSVRLLTLGVYLMSLGVHLLTLGVGLKQEFGDELDQFGWAF